MRQFLLGLSLLSFLFTRAQSASERQKHFNLEKGVAIEGYDPVAYFTLGKATKGSKQIAATYLGVTYWFLNKEHRQQFLMNPSKYEPQYGGWCAFAMGDYGKKVEINPETFKITNGKLYLFYNAYLTNTLTSWNKDEKNLREKGDKNWKQLTSF